jgi:pimeloyl-ACP methyl ester carboxylesterase
MDAEAVDAEGMDTGPREVVVERFGVQIWAEALGPADAPAVLLVAGADSSSRRWSPRVVERFLEAGMQVVRYDHRDTGRSSLLPADAVYDLDDLAADAVAVLDALDVGAVHVVGHSMGGMVGQLLALSHPTRVRTLTLLATTPAPDDERMPLPDEDLVLAIAERRFAPLPKDEAGRVAWHVELARLFAGTRYPFDEAHELSVAEAEVAWAWRPETGHGPAVFGSPGRIDRLGAIDCPTLVVHGDADRVYPPEHAHALAGGIPGASLVVVEGLGHESPPALFDELWDLLLEHFAAA